MSEQQTEAADRMSETQSLVAEYWQHRKPKYRNRRPVDVALARAVLLASLNASTEPKRISA